MKEADYMFNEEILEVILENARIMSFQQEYHEGFAGNYYEPPESPYLELSFDIVLENITAYLTAEELENYRELEKHDMVIQYIELYARDNVSLPKGFSESDIEYDDRYHSLEIKREYNRLIISVDLSI
jgi:hypothetical protein